MNGEGNYRAGWSSFISLTAIYTVRQRRSAGSPPLQLHLCTRTETLSQRGKFSCTVSVALNRGRSLIKTDCGFKSHTGICGLHQVRFCLWFGPFQLSRTSKRIHTNRWKLTNMFLFNKADVQMMMYERRRCRFLDTNHSCIGALCVTSYVTWHLFATLMRPF